VSLEDVSVGEVEPGEQDQLVAGVDPMQCVRVASIDLEDGGGCAFECLVRRLFWRGQRRPDDADLAYRVWLDPLHFVCESRTHQQVETRRAASAPRAIAPSGESGFASKSSWATGVL
jgi:hypothetical protein